MAFNVQINQEQQHQDELTQKCQTFVFNDEDATLGNSLCYCINELPRSYHVTMCGYDIPHPANDQMQIRIQTTADGHPSEALAAGCYELINIVDKYQKQVQEIIQQNAQQ